MKKPKLPRTHKELDARLQVARQEGYSTHQKYIAEELKRRDASVRRVEDYLNALKVVTALASQVGQVMQQVTHAMNNATRSRQ